MHAIRLLAAFLIAPSLALAQPVTAPNAGGPPADRAEEIGRDAGPAQHPPRTDTADTVNRGTDGSATGLQEPAATGTTPQGFLGQSTSGSAVPHAPVGGQPPQSNTGQAQPR